MRLRRASAPATSGSAPREQPVAVLVAFMGLGKVFSPQYLVWLLPLGLVAALFRSRRAAFALLALFALTQILYPYSYGALRRLETWAYLLLLGRNALLIGLGVFFALPRAGACAEGRSEEQQKAPGSVGNPGAA